MASMHIFLDALGVLWQIANAVVWCCGAFYLAGKWQERRKLRGGGTS